MENQEKVFVISLPMLWTVLCKSYVFVLLAAVIVPLCDGIVFVLKANEVRARDVMGVIKDLREKGCTVLGAVLNHVTVEKSAKTQVADFFRNIKSFFGKLF